MISVSLGTGCYRHIKISGKATLFQLHGVILDAFQFEDDHAHAFFMDNVYWSRSDSYYAREIEDELRTTDKYKLSKLKLYKGKQFKYVFDFGAEWRFQCKILQVLEEQTAQPTIIKSKGEAPSQYRSWDE